MWRERELHGSIREWERDDGYATIRLRERPSGGYVVRFDRLEQASEGEAYELRTVDTLNAAMALVETWCETYDLT